MLLLDWRLLVYLILEVLFLFSLIIALNNNFYFIIDFLNIRVIMILIFIVILFFLLFFFLL